MTLHSASTWENLHSTLETQVLPVSAHSSNNLIQGVINKVVQLQLMRVNPVRIVKELSSMLLR